MVYVTLITENSIICWYVASSTPGKPAFAIVINGVLLAGRSACVRGVQLPQC